MLYSPLLKIVPKNAPNPTPTTIIPHFNEAIDDVFGNRVSIILGSFPCFNKNIRSFLTLSIQTNMMTEAKITANINTGSIIQSFNFVHLTHDFLFGYNPSKMLL